MGFIFPGLQPSGPNWHPFVEKFRVLSLTTDELRDGLRELAEHQEHAHGQADALRMTLRGLQRTLASLGSPEGPAGNGIRPSYDQFLASVRGDRRYAEGVAYLDAEVTPRLAAIQTLLVDIQRTLDRVQPGGSRRR